MAAIFPKSLVDASQVRDCYTDSDDLMIFVTGFDFLPPSAKSTAIASMKRMLQRKLMLYLLEETGFFIYKSNGHAGFNTVTDSNYDDYWKNQICHGGGDDMDCVSALDFDKALSATDHLAVTSVGPAHFRSPNR